MLLPIVFSLTPYLVLVPSTTNPPEASSGVLVWLAITTLLSLAVIARTFALPSQIILVNNASPHLSRLGTLHGIAQSVSSAARTLGPISWSWLLGYGLSRGIVGLAYWGMAVFAVAGAAVSWFAREGNGHEIMVDGDEEEVVVVVQQGGNRE